MYPPPWEKFHFVTGHSEPRDPNTKAVTVVEGSVSMTMSLPEDVTNDSMMEDFDLVKGFRDSFAEAYSIDASKVKITGFDIFRTRELAARYDLADF